MTDFRSRRPLLFENSFVRVRRPQKSLFKQLANAVRVVANKSPRKDVEYDDLEKWVDELDLEGLAAVYDHFEGSTSKAGESTSAKPNSRATRLYLKVHRLLFEVVIR